MKFIKAIWEQRDIESPADALELPGESDYSALSREEIVALMQVSADEGDWEEVQALQFWLNKETLVPESKIWNPDEWFALNESIRQGREILGEIIRTEQRRQRESIESAVADLPEDETAAARERLLGEIERVYLEGDFLLIQDWFKSQPKWVGAFVAFRFKQGASMEQLDNIRDLMQKMRSSLGELEEPDHWIGIKPTGEDVRPGYERLGDALTDLMNLARGRWVPKALPRMSCTTPPHVEAGLGPVELREMWNKTSDEKKREVLELGAAINDLDKPNLIIAIRRRMTGIPSIDALIKMLRHQLTLVNTDRGKIMEEAVKGYPQVAVIYDGPDHAVFSFRSETMLPTLCAKARKWCIQPTWYGVGLRGRFWQYATGTLQLGVIDFTQEPSSDYHTVGWTIMPSGKINTAHDQQDTSLMAGGNDWKEAMRRFQTSSNPPHGYPDELIQEVNLYFDEELKIKTKTDDIYKEITSYSSGENDREQAMLKMIEGTVRNVNDLIKMADSAGDINSSENVAKQIIMSTIASFAQTDSTREAIKNYIDKIKKYGLPSPADAKIFEILLTNSSLMTESLIRYVIERNNAFVKKIQDMLKMASKDFKNRDDWNLRIKGLGDSTSYLETIIQKIRSSEKS